MNRPQSTTAEGKGAFARELPARPAIGARDKSAHPSGMVVVRLTAEASSVAQGAADTLVEHSRLRGLKGIHEALERAGSPKSHRLVTSVPVEKLVGLEREAMHTKYPPAHSLSQYWRIDLRDRSREEISRLLQILSELPEVDAAWEEPLSTPPIVTPGDDPYNVGQDYQDPAPDGIDARWMWTQANGEGAGVGIVDVEGGWRVTHEDLAGKAPTLIHGTQFAGWEDHGTAVLGEIVAADNSVGIVGTAPGIASVRMSSIYDATGTQNVADALTAAVAAMSVGEIMLIELQTDFLPVETLDDRLDIIRLAAARGIIVVEAAGNGNFDLDAWAAPGGQQRLNRASPDFVDSGAIMVGACVSAVDNLGGHRRWWASNYGSRIDCFAWGENVTSAGYGDLDNGGGDADKWYTDSFQGTSSASPIIVSAAALLQARYQAITGGYLLSPGQMRLLLSDPATGTPQTPGDAGAIGVMPDLAGIVPLLGLAPDVYLRDAIGDTGLVPWTGAISVSPDCIVRPSAVVNPQLAYGEGSGTENSAVLGGKVEAGQDNYIYLRVRNRGGAPAAEVVATVYWSEVATLVTPSSWHLIGTVTLPSVPVGDVLTVSPPLVWPKASIPGTGHYCFVATLQQPGDPAPPIPGQLDWASFQDMIRASNNVTWCNFNVENVLSDAPSFPFKLVGIEREAVPFAFEIERRLPADAVLELEAPVGLLARMKGGNLWQVREAGKDVKGRVPRLVLPALPRIGLGTMRLPRGTRVACALHIRVGKEKLAYGHGVSIRQLYKGKEVGRIAWQFAQEARPDVEMRKKFQ